MSSDQTIADFVVTTIAETCNLERSAVGGHCGLAELGMDSLRLTAFAAHVEAAFDCELGADQIVALFEAPRIDDVVALIEAVVLHPENPQVADSAHADSPQTDTTACIA